uniref:E-selectin-like n=1 Tax=Gouania willdenowi TaxID=441366 RepID=A0A8C5EXJ4_GOUWI
MILPCMWTGVEGWSYYYSDTTMNWTQARAWCRESYTDMVAIQNQEEIEHLNKWLPKRKTYYWIGIRKIDDVWTWVGTGKALTQEATSWAQGEPNNGKIVGTQSKGSNEDCVEMYIKRKYQPGKWNDERCSKLKTAVCYTAACKNDSCLYGECVETINSHKCDCFEGFYGEKCEKVVKCSQDELIVPHNGSVHCNHTYGSHTFGSTCQYSCEEGFQLSMQRPLRCTASKTWSEQPPTCELVQCQRLSSPAKGSMRCSNPQGPFTYQSTCTFACNEGYILTGSMTNTLQCEASGSWNSSQPICAAVRCPDLQDLENGDISCGGDADVRFSYGNSCSFSCAPGYHLLGPSRVTCTSAAKWSEQMPRCEAVTCQIPNGDESLITQCSNPLNELRPNSTCTFSCSPGFELHGTHTTVCSDDGQWSDIIPTCKAQGCTELQNPANGQIRCSNSSSSPDSAEITHPVGSLCLFSCDEGYEVEGAFSTKCTHLGQWSSKPPTCTGICISFTLKPQSTLMALTSGVATGGVALISGLSLVVWILKRLRQKASKFELNSNSETDTPPQVYKSSFDSLI